MDLQLDQGDVPPERSLFTSAGASVKSSNNPASSLAIHALHSRFSRTNERKAEGRIASLILASNSESSTVGGLSALTTLAVSI